MLGMLNRALEYLFLRLYAKNLSRSTRGDPANACADTEIQVSTILILALGMLALIIGSLFFPSSMLQWLRGRDQMLGSLIGVTLIVAFAVHRRFGGYEQEPELARKFQSRRNNRWASILFWSAIGGWLIVTLLTIQYMRH